MGFKTLRDLAVSINVGVNHSPKSSLMGGGSKRPSFRFNPDNINNRSDHTASG